MLARSRSAGTRTPGRPGRLRPFRPRAAATAATVLSTALIGAAGTVGPAAAATRPPQPNPAPPINDLARTPYQGWNTYYGLGSKFSEQTIKNEADALVKRGLKAAGYNYV